MISIDLELYRLYIENLRKEGTDEIALNSGKERATICLANIVEFATENVIIFSGKLSSNVFNDEYFLSALKKAIDRGVKFNVLIQETEVDENSKAYKMLKSATIFNPGKIDIRTGLGKIAIEERYDDQAKNAEIHFALADDKAYRIEQDTKNRKARICFCDPETVKGLSEAFYAVFQNAEALS